MKNLVIALLSVIVGPSLLFADDELNSKNQWLVDFFKFELDQAEYKSNFKKEKDYTEYTFIERSLDFKTKEYRFDYRVELKQNWDVLTKDGTESLPEIEKSFPGSRIEPWTNQKGTAVYKETFSRTVPNWMVFKSLNKLLVSLAKYDFESPVNSTFYSDEIKLLKKLQKSDDRELQKIWAQFIYDQKGQVESFSSRYVKKFIGESSSEHVELSNTQNEIIYIEAISTELNEAISGVRIHQNNQELVVFNEDLNKMLFKFAPESFPSPEKVFENYLLNLALASDKGLQRFENGMAGK